MYLHLCGRQQEDVHIHAVLVRLPYRACSSNLTLLHTVLVFCGGLKVEFSSQHNCSAQFCYCAGCWLHFLDGRAGLTVC